MPADPEASPSFYGWRIVGLAAVMLAMTAPGQTVGVSVFVDPMMATLDLTRSQLSAAYLVGTLAGALALPLVGRSIDRLGLKVRTTLVAAAFGRALIAMAGVVGLITLTLAFTGIRMLGQGSLSLTSTTAVAVWFQRRRGVAIGISSAVGAAAMSLAPLALSAMIEQFQWRLSWSLALLERNIDPLLVQGGANLDRLHRTPTNIGDLVQRQRRVRRKRPRCTLPRAATRGERRVSVIVRGAPKATLASTL